MLLLRRCVSEFFYLIIYCVRVKKVTKEKRLQIKINWKAVVCFRKRFVFALEVLLLVLGFGMLIGLVLRYVYVR